MNQDSEPLPGLLAPALVYRLARASSLRIGADLAAHGMHDLLPRHALQLFPRLLGGGLRASELASRLGVSRQAVAQVVATLQRTGYLTRIADPGDGRAKLVCLTPRGRAAGRVLLASLQALHRDWQSLLGPGDLAHLRESLQTLVTQSPDNAPPPPAL